jgi:nicotinamide riboside kinase
MRIYFIGAHSTGKTTIARHTAKRLGLPLITEVARGVLAELELSLDTLRTDIDTVTRYQREVLLRQIATEQRYPGGFVSDRAFDNIAYAAHHTLSTREFMSSEIFTDYIESLRAGIIFFVRPHKDLLKVDGVRAAVAWEEVLVIDGMVKFMLEMYDMKYIPLSCMNMQERVRTVDTIVDLHRRAPEQGSVLATEATSDVNDESMSRSE